MITMALPENGRRQPPAALYLDARGTQDLFAPGGLSERGDAKMVSFSELFQFTMIIISVVGLCLAYSNKKK